MIALSSGIRPSLVYLFTEACDDMCVHYRGCRMFTAQVSLSQGSKFGFSIVRTRTFHRASVEVGRKTIDVDRKCTNVDFVALTERKKVEFTRTELPLASTRLG